MQSRQENKGPTSTASSKLMTVDDESDMTFTLKVVLEQSGFSLDVFNDPIVALSNFKPDYYDFILLDVQALNYTRSYRKSTRTKSMFCHSIQIVL
jgi:DNA-binding response OmpR family regulator